MTWGSTTPGTITALAALFQTALPTSLVFNGPVVTDEAWDEAAWVAYQDEGVPFAVEGQLITEGFAVAPEREQYTVHCALTVQTGNDDVTVSRARVFTMLGAVGAGLAANPTLTGTVLGARIGPYSLSETPVPVTAVTVLFGVVVDAFTTT